MKCNGTAPLARHRPDLDRLVEALLQKEELQREEIEELLHTVPKAEVDGKASRPTSSEVVFAPGSIK